jgi:hypothetical protein
VSRGAELDYAWLREVLVDGLGDLLGETMLEEIVAEIQSVPGIDRLGLVKGPIRSALTERLGAAHGGQLADRLQRTLEGTSDDPLVPEETTDNEIELPPVGPSQAATGRPPSLIPISDDDLDDIADLEGVDFNTVLHHDNAFDLEIDVDFDDEHGGGLVRSDTVHVRVVGDAVPVLVVSGSGSLVDELSGRLGAALVRAITVNDESGLRHYTFSMSPLLVVVDASEPPAIRAAELARALRGQPHSVLPVLWASDLPYGRDVAIHLREEDRVILLAMTEGVEPLLDLIRSRRIR